jgi:nucleoside-diphosphate-sugar epimerase
VDVSDITALKQIFGGIREEIPAIVHFAGRASDVGFDSEFRQNNFESVKNMVVITKDFNVGRLVFISTTDVYGMSDFHGEAEDELTFPKKAGNPYPRYKIMAEKHIRETLAPDRYCIIRPAAVFGEDDPTLTARFISFLKYSPFIVHFGKWKGQNRWPMVHVDDVALAAYIGTFHEKAAGLSINVIDNKRITVDQFYRLICGLYFPGRSYRSITLPLWCGYAFGFLISAISNVFNLKKPFMEPSLYAVQTLSHNLDFSGELFSKLKENV